MRHPLRLATSLVVALVLAGCDDTPFEDAGPHDAAAPDAGEVDSGAPDAGMLDAGAPDAGPVDAGPTDAGPTDAGPTDAGPTDAGPLDAGAPDTGAPDAGPMDAGAPDAGPTCVDGTGVVAFGWVGARSASFDDCLNWSPAAVPGADGEVTVGAGAGDLDLPDGTTLASVTLEAGFTNRVRALGGLTLDGALNVGGGTFDAGSGSVTTGAVELTGTAHLDATPGVHELRGGLRIAPTATFDARAGTVRVVPSGAGTAIVDADGAVFATLETSSPGATYRFAAGAELEVTRSWIARGTSVAPVTLRLEGGTAGVDRWRIAPRRVRDLEHVDVADSENTSARRITPTSWTDAGNNVGWGALLVADTAGSFDPDPSNFVRDIDVSDGLVTLGGEFASVNGQPRQRLAVLTTAGALQSWNPSPAGTVVSLVRDGSRVFAAGTFGGGFAAYDDSGAEIFPALTGSADTAVLTTAVHDGVVYVSGGFSSFGGADRARLAAFTTDGTLLPFNPMLEGGNVEDFVFVGDTIYLAGSFSAVGGVPRAGLAAVSASTGALLDWAPALGGVNPYARSIELGGEVFYVGGIFSSVNGVPRSRLAAIDMNGELLPWDPGASAAVVGLALLDGVVYAAGTFDTVGGQPRSRLAAIDVDGHVLPWAPTANAIVQGFASASGVLYAVGSFTTINDVTQRYVVAFPAL